MSYNIYLRGAPCPTCAHEPDQSDLPNPTYNLTEIFDLALTGEPLPNPDVAEGAVVLFRVKTDRPRGLRVLTGRKASDTIEMIENALKRMSDPLWHERLRALEPENGWGTLQGAREVMQRLLQAANEYPAHIWEIH